MQIKRRSVRQSGLEEFVIGYLKKFPKGANKDASRVFIQKAIAQINLFLGHPCCDTATPTSNLITPRDNELTRTITTMLQKSNPGKVIRRFQLLALHRTLDRLNAAIYGCCTETVTITFDGTVPPANTNVQIYDVVTDTLLFASSASGTTQIATLPLKYFAKTGLVKICLNNNVAPSGVHANQVLDSNHVVLLNATGTGQTCSTTIGPLGNAYTVHQI